MGTHIRRWALLGAIAALTGAPAARAGVVEGFEKPDTVQTTGGKLDAVERGDGLTEGAAAAQIPPGVTVHIPVQGAQLSEADWLKVDAAVADPVTCAVRVGFRRAGMATDRAAYLVPGAQTLALPLSVPLADARRRTWPEGQVTIELTNRGQTPLIVDNMRLEPAADPPPGATLVDFGEDDSPSWPGFERGGEGHRAVMWSGRVRLRADAPGFPDPLAGDYLGPRLSYGARESLHLRWGSGGARVAWLWLTHYALGETPPMEYGLRCDGKVLAYERLRPAQMLSGEGLLRGRDADWTPEGFATGYAERFVRLVRIPAVDTEQDLEMLNCQLAAIATAPPSQREAMGKYVEQVQADLRRYRRQFVVGYVTRPQCTVAPTEAEQRDGLIVFRPGGERRFAADWTPQPDDRLERLELETAPGLECTGMLAVAPLRDAAYISAALETPRSDDGRALPVDPRATSVDLLRDVARVREARADFQPWVRVETLRKVPAGQLVYAAVSLAPRASARPGTYDGAVRVRLPGGQARVPVRITVHDCRPMDKVPGPEIIAISDAGAHDAQRALAAAMQDTRAANLRSRVRAMRIGIDGLRLTGPWLHEGLGLYTAPARDALAAYPAELARGLTLFSVAKAMRRLSTEGVAPGTSASRDALARWVVAMRRLARGKLRAPHADYVGSAWDLDDVTAMRPRIDDLRGAGGRPAVRLWARKLAEFDDEKLVDLLRPYQVLLLTPNHAGAHRIVSRYSAGVPGGRVYLLGNPDRYLFGFYAAALDVDGVALYRVYMSAGGPYDGFHVNGHALLVPRSDGDFARTLATIVLDQARQDHRLLRRAIQVAAEARAAGVEAGELAAVIEAIRGVARRRAVGEGAGALDTSAELAEQLDAWRHGLLTGIATVRRRIAESGGAH
ncbi:MAG: hypothetical protein ACOC8F_05800 [Planctomycetota bacterium]